MHTKEQIFEDIKQVLKHDYAGCHSKLHLNTPEQYEVSNAMTNVEFEQIIKSYLLDFKDGHLGFRTKNSELPYRGFSVRRYENTLYVTEAPTETRLKKGDKIVAIDGEIIERAAERYQKLLVDELNERQQWRNVLCIANKVTVEVEGKLLELELGAYDKPAYNPSYECFPLNTETMYMKLMDFAQAEPIQKLVRENEYALSQCKNLIIDVRINNGGNDTFYFPLLKYIFDKQIAVQDLFNDESRMFTNYTERNCALMQTFMEDYLEQELAAEVEQNIKEEIAKIHTYKGKGFVENDDETDWLIEGGDFPRNIYVLADCFCASSGDTFAQNVKKSPKVKVIGRETMGIMKTFNVVTVDYGDFEFWYGISTMDDKSPYHNGGIHPDIYIPWTPQHLTEDVDLNYVLELCEEGISK